ncbi:MAG: AAA family ATPase, partial [Pseudomonadota bacterium]
MQSVEGPGGSIIFENVFALGSIVVGQTPPVADLTLTWAPLRRARTGDDIGLFDALTWRHRLTETLVGRDAEMTALLDWAEDGLGGISVRLMSGPAGAGKTRLAAEAATALKTRQWTAGFLPQSQDHAELVRATGRGLFMILDYPEERRPLVDRLLDGISDRPGDPERPVRILLVSRRSARSWGTMAARLGHLFSRQEIATPDALSAEAALEVLTEAAVRFAALTDATIPDLAAAPAWLGADSVRRRPLYAAASGVRAVATESPAFDYGAADLMRWLAERELLRVRRISTVVGLEETELERLLAMALFVPQGLGRAEIRELAALELSETSATALASAVAKTPWWLPLANGGPPRLARLEPDQPAAAFLEAALLADPDPLLPRWMAVPAT